jgi:small subunit ribosomal protein S14
VLELVDRLGLGFNFYLKVRVQVPSSLKMQALIKKNKNLRALYKTQELESYIDLALIKNKILSASVDLTSRVGEPVEISKVGKRRAGAISKVRNICIITGRTRAVIQEYKLSRIKFKQNAESGKIPGLKKL